MRTLVGSLVLVAAAWNVAQADDATQSSGTGIAPMQIAIMAPYQLFNEQKTVVGIRLDLGYGYNRNVYGIDTGLFNDSDHERAIEIGVLNNARIDAGGLMIGLVNNTGSLWGAQFGAFNYAGTVHGGQVGGINYTTDLWGAQLGGINIAHHAHGVQLGLINFSWNLRGLQIGPLNYAHNAMGIGFLPVVNWAFKG